MSPKINTKIKFCHMSIDVVDFLVSDFLNSLNKDTKGKE